jgi:type I restriction enzyme S subunit
MGITLSYPPDLGKSPLDNKIELNRQMNATLESMAQALFKSWFVDFDPVIDNALKAGNPIPEPLQARADARAALGDQRKPLPETIQNQFPSRFVFTEEMGWVPEGWEIFNLGEIAIFKNGKKSPERESGVIPVYGSNGQIGVCTEFNRDNVIIVGRVGTYCGSLFFCNSKCWVTDNAMSAEMSLSSHNIFLLELLKLANLNDRRSGSGQPLLNQSILNTIIITKPSFKLISEYSKITTSFSKKSSFVNSSTETLTSLRDTLLPKLLSGQLRIPDAEKQLADAV